MRAHVEEALEAIEQSILPSVALMLDTLLDAASMARAGADAEDFAAELRALAFQLEGVTRQMETLHEVAPASAARICA